MEKLHIYFERSGGFAGIVLKVIIDINTLSIKDANLLRKLISDSGILEITIDKKISPKPDQFYYTIIIDNDEKKYSLNLSEQQISDKIQPLINFLVSKARMRN